MGVQDDIQWVDVGDGTGRKIPRMDIRPAAPMQELSDADVFGAQAPPPPADAQVAPPPAPPTGEMSDDQVFGAQPRSAISELGRQAVGLPARYAVEGLTAIPAMAGDFANAAVNLGSKGINAVAGTKIPMLPPVSTGISDVLTKAGLPNPENPTERTVGDVSKAIASVPAFAETAAASGFKALQPLTEGVGQQLSAAIGSSGAAGTSREAGAPWWGQILAGLAGGGAGSLRTAPKAAVTDRVAQFKNAGVRPSIGDATQQPFWQWIQKVVNVAPFADNVIAKNEAARVGQAQTRVATTAAGYGDAQSADTLGETVQDAIKDFRFGKRPDGMTDAQVITSPTRASSVSTKANVLYDRVPVAGNAVVEADKTRQALLNASTKFSNPELSAEFSSPLTDRLAGILERSNGLLTWDDLRALRTEIRNQQTKASLDPNIDDRALSQINQAITEDMMNGARVHGGERAAEMIGRADNYYRLAMEAVTNKLKSLYGANRIEDVITQIRRAASANTSKADIAKLEELRRAMPDDVWGNISATVLDDLGKPTPGTKIGPEVPQFSVDRFVTGYREMSPKARDLFFSGAGKGDLKAALDNLSKVMALMKSADAYANTSNSGNLMARVAQVGKSMALVGAAPFVGPLKIIGALAAANITARAMYNPTFVKLMTQTITASPQSRAPLIAQIARFASESPALANDSRELIKAMVPAGAQPDQSGQSK